MKDKKHPIPDDCTSMMCNNFGCEYCWECSHAIFRGRSKVNDKIYRWKYQPYYGVLFLNKDGSEVKVCPGERTPVWKRFGAWQKRRGLK